MGACQKCQIKFVFFIMSENEKNVVFSDISKSYDIFQDDSPKLLFLHLSVREYLSF